MWICICNSLNDKTVDSAIKSGAKRPSQVFAACGTKAGCGSCSKEICDRIRALKNAQGDGNTPSDDKNPG